MAKNKKRVNKKIRRRAKAGELKHVVVTARNYGNRLKGTRIYYEGSKPGGLRPDGTINLGKNVLEILTKKFGKKFRWIVSEEESSIDIKYNIARVKTSRRLLQKMSSEQIDRNRDIKNDIINRTFSTVYPSYFTAPVTSTYAPGTLANTLSADIVSKLSADDRDAITSFLPAFIAAESISSVNLLKAKAQVESLKELALELEEAIKAEHGESWWQTYVRSKILIIQQGYIKAIEKMNISIGNTKFPDFSLVTHDNYLDILEIKRPSTDILKPDSSRGNFFFDSEISKAIIQVENYISNVTKHGDTVRSYILDNHKIDLKVVRPRGIILAGSASQFTEQKQKDDFRLLSQGLKNLAIVTYDELLTRLKNYIEVLEEFSTKIPVARARPVRKTGKVEDVEQRMASVTGGE
jgi:Domain of unknown function (DUF4263)